MNRQLSEDDFEDETSPSAPIKVSPAIQNIMQTTADSSSDLFLQEKISSEVPESVPIEEKIYSLEPDYKMGWRPSTDFAGAPIPFKFEYEDSRVSSYIEKHDMSVIYQGFRPQDSLKVHETFARQGEYPFQFPSRENYMMINITREHLSRGSSIRHIGMVPNAPPVPLVFDSNFESGNLDLALLVSSFEYDLVMRTETNTRGHHQWFYFSVSNRASATIKFNLLNFTKRDSQYNCGMRIAILSKLKKQRAKRGECPEMFADWHRGGENIRYIPSKLNSEENYVGKKPYFMLSFEYNFEEPGDTV